MRRIMLLAAAVTAAALLLTIFTAGREPEPETPPEAETPSPTSVTAERDAAVTVRVLDGETVTELALDTYLTGVLAAEMPAVFEQEALKAQAVAARTYTLYKMRVQPSARHPEADVCTDSGCCKAWADEAARREKWGAEYDAYLAKLTAAVAATDGQCLFYGDEPALTVFHAASAGRTEAGADVWGAALPYLVPVETPETEETVPKLTETVTVSAADFRETVTAAYPAAVFGDDPADWIGAVTYTAGGRIGTVELGGVPVTGRALRTLFSLRSTNALISATADAVTFRTAGRGHGVGMSQYGANLLAQAGMGYADILAHYYPGTVLTGAGSNLGGTAQDG